MSKFKINIPVRMKNPWFWVGLIGVIFTAMGVNPEMLTSWGLVYNAFIELVSNPFKLATVFMAVLGIFVDPTTAEFGDSAKALTYTTPRKG